MHSQPSRIHCLHCLLACAALGLLPALDLGSLPGGHRSSTQVQIQEVQGNDWIDVGGFLTPDPSLNGGY